MPDRVDFLRQAAAKCLVMARTTTDSNTRISLITMAQNLYEALAREPNMEFPAIVQGHSDDQMSRD